MTRPAFSNLALIEKVLVEYENTDRKVASICRDLQISINSYMKYLTDDQRTRHELVAEKRRSDNRTLLKTKFGRR
jgi:hypothetical protein